MTKEKWRNAALVLLVISFCTGSALALTIGVFMFGSYIGYSRWY